MAPWHLVGSLQLVSRVLLALCPKLSIIARGPSISTNTPSKGADVHIEASPFKGASCPFLPG